MKTIDSIPHPENQKILKLQQLLELKRKVLKRKKRGRKYRELFFVYGIVSVLGLALGFLFLNKNKTPKSSNNKNLISFYESKRKNDSIRLKIMTDRIKNFEEKKEIDSILQSTYINDSLLFESDNVAKVSFKSNQTEPNLSRKKKQWKKKKNSIFDNQKSLSYYAQLEKDKKANASKSKSTIAKTKEEKFYFSTDKFAVHPGCERKSNEAKKKKCFNSKINKHISKNINKKLFKAKGIKRIDVLVAITKEGFIKILKIKTALSEMLYNEIVRVINTLPRFIPAIDNNRKVGVKFNLPIRI